MPYFLPQMVSIIFVSDYAQLRFFVMHLENLHLLRQACFSYFKLGGRAVSDPIGLLSM